MFRAFKELQNPAASDRKSHSKNISLIIGRPNTCQRSHDHNSTVARTALLLEKMMFHVHTNLARLANAESHPSGLRS